MAISFSYYIFVTLIFLGHTTVATADEASQRPPIEVDSESDCTTSNPSAVIDSNAVAKIDYQIVVSKPKPSSITETLKFTDGSLVTIVQSGCWDGQGKLTFQLSKNCKDNLKCTLDLLSNLKVKEDSYPLTPSRVKMIATTFKSESSQEPFQSTGEVLSCLMRVGGEDGSASECTTDLAISMQGKTVSFNLIDRP